MQLQEIKTLVVGCNTISSLAKDMSPTTSVYLLKTNTPAHDRHGTHMLNSYSIESLFLMIKYNTLKGIEFNQATYTTAVTTL